MKVLLSQLAAAALRENNLKLPEPDVVRIETKASEPSPRSLRSAIDFYATLNKRRE
jgi:hypothetical protein